LKKIVLATRKSPLARAQAELVAAHLRARLGATIELLPVVTTGDRQAEWSLEKMGGKGLFTSELEQALVRGEADLAVHSAKDLPGEISAGVIVAGYLPRADPRDLLVLRAGVTVPATLATGSPRRRRQAAELFPGVEFREIRGNVDTRLRKIAEQGLADGTILAAAGLARLGITGWPGLEFRPLALEEMVPAVGQAAVAIQCRTAEADSWAHLFDAATAGDLGLERAFQALLGAGCQTAFAAHVSGETLHFFHAQTGRRHLPLPPGSRENPAASAMLLLKNLGVAP
jgi:hydroxymethylbilane synthase